MMKKLLSSLRPAKWVKLAARLKADQAGNVLMIMGFAIIPLTFTVGFGVDYARAMRLQTQLNAAADSAALAAVAPAMILQSRSESTSAARKMFDAQAARLSGYQDLVMTPVIVDGASGSGGSLGYLRKATISYTVKSVNQFGGILGATTLTVTGSASASAQQPPNVDFYLAMDNSPSMLLPATSDGVAKIISATKNTADTTLPNGCAFACHAQIPHDDKIFVKDGSGYHILLSTNYYVPGNSKQNVYYRWQSLDAPGVTRDSGLLYTGKLYNSAGQAMNSTTAMTGSPITTSTVTGPTTTTSGSGSNKTTKTTTKTTNDTKTVTTTTVVTYSITDSKNAPVIITKKTVETPTTQTSTTVTTQIDTKIGNGPTTTSTTTSSPTTSTSTGAATTSSTTFDTGYWADGFWLTHNYGQIYSSPSSITLRKDDMVSAATQLIPFATNQAAQYQVTYRAQMFSFDWTRSGNTTPVRTLNTLSDVSSYGSAFSAANLFPADDYWFKNSYPVSGTSIDDKATEITNMLTTMKNTIPTAGSGAPGATPQKILFLITDGMLDQPNGSGRYFGPMRSTEQTECTAIKAKGIKIAILYTQYLPTLGHRRTSPRFCRLHHGPMQPATRGVLIEFLLH
jgi:Flp pilus assembly protein TadG